jgi:hypothetical protein
MSKIIVVFSFFSAILSIHFGMSAKAQADDLRIQDAQLQVDNFNMEQKIKDKRSLVEHPPVPIATEYSVVLNQIRLLESGGGTRMNVQLEGVVDNQDVSTHYEDTIYRGIRGLNVQIVVNKFSTETDMGAVLDDIHLLEKNTDFVSTEIIKNDNNLIVKGEVYGL